jgi:serine/threonine protein kinase
VVFDDKYGKECDYWSLGVLAFYLLSGDMPFDDDNREILFEKIRKCEFNFNNKIW